MKRNLKFFDRNIKGSILNSLLQSEKICYISSFYVCVPQSSWKMGPYYHSSIPTNASWSKVSRLNFVYQ